MKKIIAAFIAGALSVTLLSSCGNIPANTVHSVDDLTGKTIGVQLGTTGDIYVSDPETVKDAKVERYKKGSEAILALKQGKVDAVVIDDEPAKVFVSKNDDLKILDEAFTVEEYAIAIKKGNDTLTEEINGALKTIRENGTLDNILKNWVGDDTGKTPYTTPEGTKYTKGKLVMATNAEFPPYESFEGDKVVGIDADMMKAVCDVLGYELVIENMDFDAILSSIETGKADVGVAGMTVTKDRLKNVNFTESYTTATQVIVVRNS